MTHAPSNALSASSVDTPTNDVLTIQDVARWLRVPNSTIYKLARNGTFPASKIGKHWRLTRGGVLDWLRHHPHPTISPSSIM